ncbi:MAG: NPCBM/NEW2 domain-containing protein [Verrucomicrobiota bacterium]
MKQRLFLLFGSLTILFPHAWKTTGAGAEKTGQMEFTIVGDGRELWRSGPLKPMTSKSFSIAVADVNQLELKSQAATTNLNGTWGLWLEPVLRR